MKPAQVFLQVAISFFSSHDLSSDQLFLLCILQHVKTSCQTVQCISSLRPSVMALKSSLPSTAQVHVATVVIITVIWYFK